MNNQIVTVNLVPGLSAPAVIRVSQYDVGRPLTIRVFDGAGAASFGSSVTATIVGTKPSGLGFTESGTIAGNTVTLNTTLAMTQECGKIQAEIRFTQTGENIGTANFILAVEPSPHPDGTTDGTTETARTILEQATEAAQSAQASAETAEAAAEAVTDKYSAPYTVTSASQMTDETKVYLYEGNESGYTAGNWYYYNGSAWVSGGQYGEGVEIDTTLSVSGRAADAKVVGDEISNLKEDLSKVINEKTTVLPSAQSYYIEFHLVAGKTYNITNKGTSAQFTMNTRATKAGANLEIIGTFRADETKQFTPAENAEWLVGYANSATTIYITEDGVLFSRVGELEDNVDTNTEHIDYALSETCNYSNNGLERLHGFWDYGNIISGTIDHNIKYRAVSPLQVFDRDVVLTPVDPANFSYSYSLADENGNITVSSPWITDATTNVRAGQHFYVVVKRNTEDMSERIDPDEFAGKLVINTKLYDIISSAVGESEIVALNKSQEQIIYNLQKGRSTRFNDTFSPLTFIHFSDIHRAETLWKRLCEYMDKYHSVIPFALHTGDYVKAYIEQYTDLYATQTPTNGYILNCVGNHDTYANSTGTEKATAETVYNLLFNHISDWGVTFGTGSNVMYYYKDFASSGIRLIVLDQYYWDSTEEAWLQNLLDDARTNNLAVITASHTNTAPLLAENRVDCTFTSYDTTWDGGEQTITFVANLDTMIKAFKDAGGEHICHLSGHWHHDIIGHTANGTLCICIECATSDHANWCDSERMAGTKGYDCFNVISADRSLHQIRLVRIGNSVDFYGREKNILCYDYLNKTVITNS